MYSVSRIFEICCVDLPGPSPPPPTVFLLFADFFTELTGPKYNMWRSSFHCTYLLWHQKGIESVYCTWRKSTRVPVFTVIKIGIDGKMLLPLSRKIQARTHPQSCFFAAEVP